MADVLPFRPGPRSGAGPCGRLAQQFWTWRQWHTEVLLPPGDHELVARAWDTTAATQPESATGLWNPKGYVNNSWARVRVTAQ